jgi:deazaflavin-dependent oxidoreductase (nitroreductase family)
MTGRVLNTFRMVTRATRPLALRRAGKPGSKTSVVRHIGRRTGQSYQTPVVAVGHDDTIYVALPYGQRTDWLKNVLATGSTTIVSGGLSYDVDQPEVIPMAEATGFFEAKEQRLHRRFGVDTCLRAHRTA